MPTEIEVDVADDDIDRGIEDRNVKVSCRVGISHALVYIAVTKVLGETVVEAISKSFSPREYEVTLKSNADAEKLREADPVNIDGIIIMFGNNKLRRVQFSVHWLPRSFKDSFLQKIFTKFGKVLDIYERSSENQDFKNGIRVVDMVLSHNNFGEVPHMLTFYHGTCKALITARGRLPLCLRCRCIGHKGGECPKLNQPPTYAEKLSGRQREEVPVEIQDHIEQTVGESETSMKENDEESPLGTSGNLSDSSSGESDDEMDMGTTATKRALDDEENDGFKMVEGKGTTKLRRANEVSLNHNNNT
ncbi:hypothetical protein LOTGIDRAFT_173704 [Lottia gigantea]|uniref:CCHC-type domain-containing protein n=1 Tax=Lottia gigantea TaxID=225164 RepID=V4B0G0_LOTGI|nr:hypothetical protein LOTGIDRAFT_173704 [Lottia gigantea]ESO99561.1 hypothetical protein LOTGIDRAFT_173704 [Lottia gigantea]